ncbi:MAG: nucleotide exchange factor GrpE, partial [Candidatus Bipolaricaulia bacterium]
GVHLAFENYNRDHDAEAFVAGIERIFAQFEQILKAKGVARIDAIGESFDPAVHEALLSLQSDQEKNTIVEVFSPGYARNGRTLRPSKVGVSQGSAAVKEEEE